MWSLARPSRGWWAGPEQSSDSSAASRLFPQQVLRALSMWRLHACRADWPPSHRVFSTRSSFKCGSLTTRRVRQPFKSQREEAFPQSERGWVQEEAHDSQSSHKAGPASQASRPCGRSGPAPRRDAHWVSCCHLQSPDNHEEESCIPLLPRAR